MRRTRMLVRAALLALFVGRAGAQLNLLTPREAVRIVELIPEVSEARTQGFCPIFSVSYGDVVDKLGIQVRCGCGWRAGQWITTYEIDLRTGAAYRLQGKEPVRSPAGDALAKTLLKEAAARVLSPEECRCLALEAAKSLPGWGGPGHDVSVEPSDPFGLRFRARLRTQAPPMVSEQFLTVDRSTAHVHNDRTGFEVLSSSLASLASRMRALRLPLLLSEVDALEIARRVPAVRAQALKPCSVFYVGGPLSWNDILVDVQSHCEGAPDASTVLVAVNPETGRVTDPDNLKHFESSEAERVARERLNEIERERAAIRKGLNAACRPQ